MQLSWIVLSFTQSQWRGHPLCHVLSFTGVPSLHSYSFRTACRVHSPPFPLHLPVYFLTCLVWQYLIKRWWFYSIFWKFSLSGVFGGGRFWLQSHLIFIRVALSLRDTVWKAFVYVLSHPYSCSSTSSTLAHFTLSDITALDLKACDHMAPYFPSPSEFSLHFLCTAFPSSLPLPTSYPR